MDSFFNRIVERLVAAKIASPRLEARLIFARATGKDTGWCDTLSPKQQKEVEYMTERRCAHEPLDKIVGYKEFYKFRFAVNSNVLSPRPDSELLVEKALELAKKHNLRRIFEFGVGSGCLLLSVLADLPEATGTGIDKSEKALEIARINCRYLALEQRARLCLVDYMQENVSGAYDLVISNPPYIPSGDIAGLETEVREYDPATALDGGADGLEHYRRLANLVPDMLNAGGFVLLEGGAGQADDIMFIFAARGLQPVAKYCDLGGIERCIILKK